MKSIIWKLTGLFIAVKLAQCLILSLVPQQFDTSSYLIIDSYRDDYENYVQSSWYPQITEILLAKVVNKFIVWDAVYFSEFFLNGLKFEHEFVFCPLYWRFIHHLPLAMGNFYGKLVIALCLNNILHYVTSLILFALTQKTFQHVISNQQRLSKLAFNASVVFILSPAGIFLTAPYSETPCCFLSFLAILMRELSLNVTDYSRANSKMSIKASFHKLLYFLSGSFVAINYGIRSNSILLGVFYLYDLVEFLLDQQYGDAICLILTGSQLFLSICFSYYYNYEQFCPERGEWCNDTIPSLFSYSQSHYWNVGFLKYWTPNNLPNFLFAAPTIFIGFMSCRYFYKIFPMRSLIPHLISILILLLGGIFFYHSQILTRIASSSPVSTWLIAAMLSSNFQSEKTFGKIFLYYGVIWSLLQTVLFGAFLPPA